MQNPRRFESTNTEQANSWIEVGSVGSRLVVAPEDLSLCFDRGLLRSVAALSLYGQGEDVARECVCDS